MLQTVRTEKPCRVCARGFLPLQPLQVVCSPTCARKMGPLARKAAKADRQQTRARLEELKPLTYWVKQAQVAFNSWIKVRDRALPCISCGKGEGASWNGQDFHAGHFLSTGARPELRFDEANVHKQCAACNTHLSGNLILYRVGLVGRIGQAEVDRLEGPHEPKRYRADDLKAITTEYRARLKAARCN